MINTGDILITTSDTKHLVLKGVKTGRIETPFGDSHKLYNSFSTQQKGVDTDYIVIFDGNFTRKVSMEEVDKIYKDKIKANNIIINHFKNLWY